MPYVVELILLLPPAALQVGIRMSDRRPIPFDLFGSAEFATEAEAEQHAVLIQRCGYAAAITDPDGDQRLIPPQ